MTFSHRLAGAPPAPPLARRSVAGLVLLGLLLALTALAAAPAAHAADRGFSSRFSTNDTGDIDIFGNTLMTCPPSVSTCDAPNNGRNATPLTSGTDYAQANNGYNMQYVNVDNDASTFNSSQSKVTLPAGSTILFAGLYWGGRTSAGSGGSAAPNASQRGTVKFKAPGDAGYASITASTLDDSSSANVYQGFADVTDRVRAAGTGTYAVANVQSGTGADGLAGWSIVIAYRDTAQPARNLTVFDGLKSISSSGSSTISVSGFKTPPAGDVNTTVGFVTYEGDSGIAGDSASLNGTTLSDAQHPATNFFDSRSSRDGKLRSGNTPSYANNLGFEHAMLGVGKPVVRNNDTSATIGLSTTGDVYAPGVVTFATDLYAPRIDQTKTVTDLNGGAVEQGDVLRYTIEGRNSGQDGAASFVLRDPIPANTAYKAGSLQVSPAAGGTSTSAATDGAGDDRAEYDGANRRVVARIGTGSNATAGGTLAVDTSYRVVFDVTVGGPTPAIADGTDVANLATSSFNSVSLGTPLTAESTAVATVRSPDLTLEKEGVGAFTAGSPYDYRLTVRNGGGARTQGAVTVTDALPTGLTPRGTPAAEGAGWSCTTTDRTFTCTRADALSVGAAYPTITLHTDVAPGVSGTVANTALVAGGGDGDPSNNTGTSAGTPSRRADLSITKTASVTDVAVGGTVSYALEVRNGGTSDSTGSTVTDALPAGLVLVSADGCSGTAGSGTVSCAVGPLASGATKRFTVVAKPAVGTAGSTLRNSASVAGLDPDPVLGNNDAAASVAVRPVDLVVSNAIDGNPEQLSPSTSYTWLVGVRNVGGSDAPGTVVRFAVPAGTVATAATLPTGCALSGAEGKQVVTCDLGTVAAGATAGGAPLRIPLRTTGTPPSSVDSTATASTVETDADLSNNTATTSTPVVSAIDLGVALHSDRGSTSAGDTVKVTATVSNAGPGTPQNPMLSVPVPVGTTFVSADAGCVLAQDGRNVLCTLEPSRLGKGQSVDVGLAFKVQPSVGDSVAFRADVSAPNDTDLSNNGAVLPLPVVKVAGLSIAKTASTSQAKPGEAVVYTLTAANAGPAAAQDVVVNDTLPAGTTYVAATGAGATCTAVGGQLTCALGTVPAGTSRAVEVRTTVDPIASNPDPNRGHQLDITKVEADLPVAAHSTATQDVSCPAGYVATDGSVRVDDVDQGTGTFANAHVLASRATTDGSGWTGTVRNDADGRLQTKVNVVCATRATTEVAGHRHELLVSKPVTSSAELAAGRHEIALTCGAGRVAIAPGVRFEGGDATVLRSVRDGAGWRFVVSVPEATDATFGIRCLSTTTTVAAGHTHDLSLAQLGSREVTVAPGQSAEVALVCADDAKGVVASTDVDPGLVSRGSDPQPKTRLFRFYNPTGAPLKARVDLLCLGVRTGGELAVKDVANTASVTTSTADATTADDSATATFRATAAAGPVAEDPAPAPAATPAPAPAAPTTKAAPSQTTTPAPTARVLARVALASSALSVSTDSTPTVTAKVRCTAGSGACGGTATLTAVRRVGSVKKGGTLATARFRVSVGRTGTVRLRPTKATAKLLRSGRVTRARLVIRVPGQATRTTTVRLRRR